MHTERSICINPPESATLDRYMMPQKVFTENGLCVTCGSAPKQFYFFLVLVQKKNRFNFTDNTLYTISTFDKHFMSFSLFMHPLSKLVALIQDNELHLKQNLKTNFNMC